MAPGCLNVLNRGDENTEADSIRSEKGSGSQQFSSQISNEKSSGCVSCAPGISSVCSICCSEQDRCMFTRKQSCRKSACSSRNGWEAEGALQRKSGTSYCCPDTDSQKQALTIAALAEPPAAPFTAGGGVALKGHHPVVRHRNVTPRPLSRPDKTLSDPGIQSVADQQRAKQQRVFLHPAA